jgi:AsmA protein
MSRRIILILTLVALAVLATTAAPWTLSEGGFARSVAEQLGKGYGIDLEVRGRSTFALLPVPRMKFEDVTLKARDGSLQAKGGTLRGELRVLSLLRGRVELTELGLSDSQVTLADGTVKSLNLNRAIAIFGKRKEVSRLRRIALSNTSVQWGPGPDGWLDRVSGVISWRDPTDRMEMTGSAYWRGERVEITHATFNPALAAAGKPSPFTLGMTGAGGQLIASGEAQLGTDPGVTGTSTLAFRSVRDFSRWSSLDLPLGSLMQAVSIKGEFSADRRRLSWPSVEVKLGGDALEGALTIRVEGKRPVVSGTLAAEQLNLSDFFSRFAQAQTNAGFWSGDDILLEGSTGGDLDLRLSATDAKLGRLRVGDMAASILVKPGRIEASLGRAGIRSGSLKGRLLLQSAGSGTDVKAQGSFDHVDLAAVLADFGERRWITGNAQGQFTLEGSGKTVADLVRQTQGRVVLAVKQGELVGIGLNDVLRRIEKQPLAASLDWRGGRTSFDQVLVNMTIGAGIGEITEGALNAPSMHTVLQGRVSLIDRSLAVRALVNPATPVASAVLPDVSAIEFDITGSWDDVDVAPDVKALIERSGAAKRLLGLDRLAPSAQGTSATPVTSAQ